jgi:hypothetical protein
VAEETGEETGDERRRVAAGVGERGRGGGVGLAALI